MAYDDESKAFVEARKAADYNAEAGNVRESCSLCPFSCDAIDDKRWCNKLGMSVVKTGWCKFFPSDVSRGDTCWFSDKKCPECGSTLNTNGRVYWCSFVGDQRQNIKACDYRIRCNGYCNEQENRGE